MCITSGHAKLSNTKILSFRLDTGKHLLAYANTVQNLSGKINSMILPVPGALTKEDFYDTTLYADFFKELEEMFKPRSRSLGFATKGGGSPSVEQFTLGMYDILISADVGALADVLGRLPDDKRPEISTDLLEFYAEAYPGWSLVICMFSGRKPVDAQPIMFTYRPIFQDHLFFPGVDSHHGGRPRLKTQVAVDHFLFASDVNGFAKKHFVAPVPEILKGQKLIGRQFKGAAMNGDWWYPTETDPKDTNPAGYHFHRMSPMALHDDAT